MATLADKTCTNCKDCLLLSSFGVNSSSKDGLMHRCKNCMKQSRDAKKALETAEQAIVRRAKQREYLKNYRSVAENRERFRNNSREQKRRLRSTPEGRATNAAVVKRWRENNPEEWRAMGRNAYSKRKAAEKGNQSCFVSTREARKIISSPCANCGTLDNIHLDHIIPLSRGGRHSVGNLQPLCQYCNLSKNNKLQIEWRKNSGNVGKLYVESGIS